MKLLLTSVVACLVLLGQTIGNQTATVYQRIATGIGAGTTNTSPVRNIGQVSHSLVVVVTSLTTCNLPNIFTTSAYIQASFDGTNWFNISNQITASQSGTYTGHAFGSYPYIRAQLLNGSAGACAMAAYYSGALGSFNPASYRPLAPQNLVGVSGGAGNSAFTPSFGTTTNYIISGVLISNDSGSAAKVTNINCFDPGVTQRTVVGVTMVPANSSIMIQTGGGEIMGSCIGQIVTTEAPVTTLHYTFYIRKVEN